MEINKIIQGDCLTGLKGLPDNVIDCCITSPPYYGLRDYGHSEQIGLEETPEMYVQKLVEVFEQVRRVLKPEGTLWLNLGDSYANSGNQNKGGSDKQRSNKGAGFIERKIKHGLKEKDLIGIPWAVAFALRSAGWYLRQDIIWHKPNPMPESVTDRCTKAHEYIFLLSKSGKYYYDAEAISENCVYGLDMGLLRSKKGINGKDPNQILQSRREIDSRTAGDGQRNKRSVWTVTTMPYSDAHFATFPERLITDCIKAGCPENGIVLDPFMGAGTTALVASKLNRNFIGFELNGQYIKIAQKRLRNQLGMFNKSIL